MAMEKTAVLPAGIAVLPEECSTTPEGRKIVAVRVPERRLVNSPRVGLAAVKYAQEELRIDNPMIVALAGRSRPAAGGGVIREVHVTGGLSRTVR